MRIKNSFASVSRQQHIKKKKVIGATAKEPLKTIERTSHEYKYIVITNYRRKQLNTDDHYFI